MNTDGPCLSYPIAVFDCETTGIGEDDVPVEVAIARFEDGEVVARWSSLVNPMRPIPADATAVHGITDEMVSSAPTLWDLAPEMLRVSGGAWPCAYNAPFDRRMLHAQVSGKDCPLFDPDVEWIDPLVIVRDVDRFVPGSGRHRLDIACARHGVQREGDAHRALSDALCAGHLLFRLRGHVEHLSMDAFLRKQRARAAAQDADRQAYMARRMEG